MEQAAILKSGIVVKLTNMINPKYTIYGFLSTFEIIINGETKKFKQTVSNDFREEDQNKEAIGGFYEEKIFLEYLADKVNKFHLLKRYDFKLATKGDEINVRKLKVVSPYTDFCTIETYKWVYEPNISIIDNGTWQIIVPAGILPNPLEGENIQLHSTAMQFYNHKIGLFVTPLTNTNDKQSKAFLFAKIAIQINQIIKDVFSLFTIESSQDFSTYLNNQNFEWTNKTIFINPTTEILEDYLRNLSYFYKSAYTNQLFIKAAEKESKFYWLARALSAEGLSVVPTIDKIILLEKISGFRKVLTEYNDGESLVLKIVESFTFDSVAATERNDFLNHLMENQVYDVNYNGRDLSLDQHKTLFEILYSKIDDNRTGRYTIGPLAYTFGLLNTKDNRKKLILMLYKIWKSSEYNPKYADPSYTQPINIFGVYPQSYYMKLLNNSDGSGALTVHYDPETSPAVLVYSSSSTSSSNNSTDYYLKTTDVNYIIGDIKGKKIEISKQKITSSLVNTPDGPLAFSVRDEPTLYGTYELYQPISIIGFKPDLDLVETIKDPETEIVVEGDRFPNIPVFFLYYMQDYSDLKKLDFGIVAIAEIAMTLSGAGALNDLKYLGYLSKARSVWTGTATASETVLFWKAVEGVNSTVQFTADNLSVINSYANNTTTDPDIKKFTDKVSTLFDTLTIVSLGTDPILKKRLFNAATEVLAEERRLILLEKDHGLSPDTIDAIKAIADIEDLLDLMQFKLENLPPYANDNILTTFSTFTDDEKYEFFTYFYNVQEESKWTKMNFQHSRVVNGQTEVYTWIDVWKNEIQHLKKQRTFEFLECFHLIRNDSKLLEHIHKGNGGLSSGNPWATGCHNLDLIDGVKWRWADETNVLTDSKGYKHGKIQRNMSDKGWTGGKPPTPWKVKKDATTFWKKFSDNPLENIQRINEEMSLAFSNKTFTHFQYNRDGLTIKSDIYHGYASDGKKIEIVLDHITKNVVSIYPTFP